MHRYSLSLTLQIIHLLMTSVKGEGGSQMIKSDEMQGGNRC